jgi:hypothetical protein
MVRLNRLSGRDLTADSITSGPSEIPRLDAYLVSESTESSSRHCRQRATQSRRRASAVAYAVHTVPSSVRPAARRYILHVRGPSNLQFVGANSMFRCGGRCREVTRRVWHDVVKLIGV